MSFAAEQAIIGALLLEQQRAFEKVQPLSAKQFSDLNHIAIFSAMEEMFSKNIHVDVITVNDKLKSKGLEILDYLVELSQLSGGSFGIKKHAEIVKNDALNRSLSEAIYQSQDIFAKNIDFATKLDSISSLFLSIERGQLTKSPKTLAEIALNRTKHYEDLQSGTVKAGWSTHIPTLDNMLSGGFRPGAQYVLAARPSIGKSSFAQSLGLAFAKDGHKVLFLSQEMPEEELADRSVANRGRINFGNLLTGKLSSDDWSRTVDAVSATELSNFYVDDQPALTLQDVRSKAKQIKGLSVLIIDYLQLCSGNSGNRNAEIESISRGLKALAKEMKIATIVLSQLNRQVEQRTDKRPNLSDLRDSGAIEQDADVVMFLWPVRQLNPEAKLVGLGIDKNRQGRGGQFGLHFEGNVQRWSESTESVEHKPMIGVKHGFSD